MWNGKEAKKDSRGIKMIKSIGKKERNRLMFIEKRWKQSYHVETMREG